ncbi:MAG: RpiB/LacA/LacB family sugar-phosphate isomerase [Chloroflexi bacterium]|nr:RpiB/LacA/LacB family sugar-phosphate isomerase [Chloroflexota bacterium]
MRLAVGSDECTSLTEAVAAELRRRGYEVLPFGALAATDPQWPDVARNVADAVARGLCDQGVLFCWTGTGVSIVANKVPGIRAALCVDAVTAAGARRWNDANVLCMSLRHTSEAVAKEILDAWLNTAPDPSEAENIRKVADMERQFAVH